MRISKCRICRGSQLDTLLDLGQMAMTGVFPRNADEPVPSEPIELIKCAQCDLVQLAHSYDPKLLYGQNYGYRSGLNGSMVKHLGEKVQTITQKVDLQPGDLILDIGSNDGTLLKAYPDRGLERVGIDPSGAKFAHYYAAGVRLIPDFFTAQLVRESFPTKKAKVVTSIAMFYDLENPLAFMQDVSSILADDGIWVFEQSYLKAMLDTNSYDTICHEHLEYYALKQIKDLTEAADLKILDVEFNAINGGSFSVMVSKKNSKYAEAKTLVESILKAEEDAGLGSLQTYRDFAVRVAEHRTHLRQLFTDLQAKGKKVIGYGASTKGNVLLQYCGITAQDLCCIAEVNEDKFGSFTPGSLIPIVSETEARKMNPDYFFILPWHFKTGILAREQPFLKAGGKFILPLPEIETVSTL